MNMQDEDGETALVSACRNEKAAVELALLGVDNINVDFQRNSDGMECFGESSLHFASIKGMLEVVNRLLEKGADVNMQDEDGETALISACYGKHTAVALALLGVDNINVDLRTNDGESALHTASKNGLAGAWTFVWRRRVSRRRHGVGGRGAAVGAASTTLMWI